MPLGILFGGEGMPSQVFRVEPLSMEEWRVLIMHHLGKIKPMLSKLTLPKLGDLHCLPAKGLGLAITLRSSKEYIQLPKEQLQEILNQEGIFWTAYEQGGIDVLESGCQYLWGITRQARWMLVTLDIVPYRERSSNFSGSVCFGLSVRTSNLDEILKLVWSPMAILQGMSVALAQTENKMQERLSMLQYVKELLIEDLSAAKMIPTNG